MEIQEELHEALESQASDQTESNEREKANLRRDQLPPSGSSQTDIQYENEEQGSLSHFTTPKTHHISVYFASNRNTRFWYTAQKWSACLSLETCDLPYLMKEGFYWDKTSIEAESSYYLRVEELLAAEVQQGWKCSRTYHCSKMRGSIMQWKGTLRIFALKTEDIARFNLDILTPDAVHGMVVRDAEKRIVYQHFRQRPEESCNTYYENMPMDGYWPWPKGGA